MKVLWVVVLSIWGQFVFGQTCCSGGVPLSNNLGLPNEGAGSLMVALNYDLNSLNTLKTSSTTLDDDSRKRLTHSFLVNLSYGVTDRLAAEFLFSWVNQSRTVLQFGNENLTETSGIGDAVLLIKYAFPEMGLPNSTLTIGAGTKLPLGASDLRTENGVQLTADLQPGSGAWDGVGWLLYSYNPNFSPSSSIVGSATYRLTGTNTSYLNDSSSYKFGNELQLILGVTDQLFLIRTLVTPGLTFRYRQAKKDRIEDQQLPNTGGRWIFARPEVQVQVVENLNINFRFELPLYANVEGTQLSPSSRLTAGLTYVFKKKGDFITNDL